MASTQSYVGMRTPFGVIVEVEARVYDPLCVVKAKDGSTGKYRLPFLVVMGFILTTSATEGGESREVVGGEKVASKRAPTIRYRDGSTGQFVPDAVGERRPTRTILDVMDGSASGRNTHTVERDIFLRAASYGLHDE